MLSEAKDLCILFAASILSQSPADYAPELRLISGPTLARDWKLEPQGWPQPAIRYNEKPCR